MESFGVLVDLLGNNTFPNNFFFLPPSWGLELSIQSLPSSIYLFVVSGVFSEELGASHFHYHSLYSIASQSLR